MNALLALIKKAGFDPRRFTRRDVTTDTDFVNDRYCTYFHELELVETGIDFIIAADWSEGTRIFSCRSTRCSLGHEGPHAGAVEGWEKWTASFEDVEKMFSEWLNVEAKKYFLYLAEEEEDEITPDLWAELDVTSADLALLENTPFSEDERKRISDTLGKFLDEVEGRALVAEDAFRLLRDRVEYAIESSKRLSRKDWIMATTGALMGYVVQVGLTGPVANQILQLAGDALNWIWLARPLLSN